ncbi:MAG: YajQ family cyclic di-GMP-binding protein [Acidobacteria bacterium]|nr:YajQ family cyclic di-GMP-binding protein [Acidobacteriota bacterium]
MPSFDVVSEIDMQEVRNAVDQAQRELATRFDFKDTNSSIELGKSDLTLRSNSEDRLRAVRQVVEEKFVKRHISLKTLDWGKIEEASGQSVRQVVTLKAGISSDDARDLNKRIKALNLKGIQSQTQGEAIRVTGKKRDDLQAVIAGLKEAELELPLQFNNFRD